MAASSRLGIGTALGQMRTGVGTHECRREAAAAEGGVGDCGQDFRLLPPTGSGDRPPL